MENKSTATLGCIIPAKNESGNLEGVISAIREVPEISQVIIVEGGSTDDTAEQIQLLVSRYPSYIAFAQQKGKGKFNAVLEGAKYLETEMMVVWDADNTVNLEDTKLILKQATLTGKSVVGDRLRGHRDKGAMRFANLIGNWVFAFLWSPINNRKSQDMLCGTKVFHRRVFLSIPKWMIDLDPFGDFALVANSFRLGHPVTYVPVRYHARTYGNTNIRRWRSGFILLRFMTVFYFRMLTKKV